MRPVTVKQQKEIDKLMIQFKKRNPHDYISFDIDNSYHFDSYKQEFSFYSQSSGFIRFNNPEDLITHLKERINNELNRN